MTRSVIRRVDWTCAPDRSEGAPQGLLHEFQCTACGETGQCSEDFETARDFTFRHVGHNPRHTGYREIVHRFWRMHMDG